MKVPMDLLALCTIIQYAFRAAGLGEAEETTALSQWKRFISPHVTDLFMLVISGHSGRCCGLPICE